MSGISCIVVLFLVFQIVCDSAEFKNGMRSLSQWVGGCGMGVTCEIDVEMSHERRWFGVWLSCNIVQ